jgi:multicomponent Na+:H+ antiporter subunit B
VSDGLLIGFLFALAAVGATAVALCRDPRPQVYLFSLYGLVLVTLFFALRAADVAYAQLAVGVGIQPLMILVALSRVESQEEHPEEEAEP